MEIYKTQCQLLSFGVEVSGSVRVFRSNLEHTRSLFHVDGVYASSVNFDGDIARIFELWYGELGNLIARRRPV